MNEKGKNSGESLYHYASRLDLENEIQFKKDNHRSKFSVIWYTDHSVNDRIMFFCLENLYRAIGNEGELILVSWKPIDFPFGKNIIFEGRKRTLGNLLNQILFGIEFCSGEYIFLAEHDVLYPKKYFSKFLDFMKCKDNENRFYYNQNIFFLTPDGVFAKKDYYNKGRGTDWPYLSQAGACFKNMYEGILSRKNALYKISPTGDIPFWIEPQDCDNLKIEFYESPFPTIDIRHGGNFSGPRDSSGIKTIKTLTFWEDTKKLQKETGLN